MHIYAPVLQYMLYLIAIGLSPDGSSTVQWRTEGGFGVFKPPRNSEDIGGVLDRMSKNRRFNFLL